MPVATEIPSNCDDRGMLPRAIVHVRMPYFTSK